MRALSRLFRAGRFVIPGLLVLVLAGCQNKITKANYDKIEEGMSLQAVEKILGSGSQQGDGSGGAAQFGVHIPAAQGGANTERVLWENDKASITIIFVDGRVKTKIPRGL